MIRGLERYNFFCDMDGVLTNFDKHFSEHTGGFVFSEIEATKGPSIAWGMIKNIPDFWLRLQPMDDMLELWEFISPYRPILLSSPGKHDTARAMVQKREWVNKVISKRQPLIFCSAEQKSRYANGSSILIDDWKPTILRWGNSGGIAIHHENSKNSIAKIEQYTDSKILGDIFDYL